jgi:ribonuclease III
MHDPKHFSLQTNLRHVFKDATLLHQALRHKSMGGKSNERFEFLGDAILNYTVAEMLYQRFPTLAEGELSRVRAGMVCHESLVKIANRIGVAPVLEVDQAYRVEKSKDSILSDALEALFAAVQLDAGHEAAKAVIIHHMLILLERGEANLGKDAKTALQEHLQARGIPVPTYSVVSQGEPGARTFEVQCSVPRLNIVTTGKGANRKLAEKDAAAKALKKCGTA